MSSKHKVLLVTGGGRSGKSRYALERASAYGRKGFVATAEAFDDEIVLLRLETARAVHDTTSDLHEIGRLQEELQLTARLLGEEPVRVIPPVVLDIALLMRARVEIELPSGVRSAGQRSGPRAGGVDQHGVHHRIHDRVGLKSPLPSQHRVELHST